MGVIYKIINIITNDEYIGSAVNFNGRKSKHIKQLKEKKHHSIFLQNSWNKYGEINFSFIIVEYVIDNKFLIQREQWWIDNSNSTFNMCKIAGSTLGLKHSDEARENNRKAKLGTKLSKETIEKRSLKQSGENHWTRKSGGHKPKTKEKITNGLVEHFKKNGHHNKGKKIMPLDSKKSISDSLKYYFKNNVHQSLGRKMSDEQKSKNGEWNKKQIEQYTKDGVFIKIWDSIIEAAKFLGISDCTIRDVCRGRNKTAGGYKWKYKNKQI